MNIGVWVIVALIVIYIFTKRSDLCGLYARRLYVTDRPQKAIKAFAFADKIGKMSGENKLVYGYVLLREGHLEEARKVLTVASMNPLEKEDVKKRIKSMRALIAWKDGDLKLAIEILEEVAAVYKNTSVFQNLGLMYIIDKNKEKAVEFCEMAYEYNSSDNVLLDNLCEAYVLAGDLEKAKEHYEILMERNPQFPEAYYGYGQLKIKLGEKENGIELIRKSLDMKFTFLSVLQKEDVEKMLSELS